MMEHRAALGFSVKIGLMVLLTTAVFFSCVFAGVSIRNRFTALEDRVQKIEQSHGH